MSDVTVNHTYNVDYTEASPGAVVVHPLVGTTGYQFTATPGTGPRSNQAYYFDSRLGTLNLESLQISYRADITVYSNPNLNTGPIGTEANLSNILTAPGTNLNRVFTTDGELDGTPSHIYHFSGELGSVSTNPILGGSNVKLITTINTAAGDPSVTNGGISTGTTSSNPSVSFSYHAEIDTTLSYTPLTTAQYIAQALARNDRGLGDYQTAFDAYWDLISLRNSSTDTGSQNINLRNAEYFIRAYEGGIGSLSQTFLNQDNIGNQNIVQAFVNEVSNQHAREAVRVYNYIKAVYADDLRPGYSLPGGEAEVDAGFSAGQRHIPMRNLQDPSTVQQLLDNSQPGSSPQPSPSSLQILGPISPLSQSSTAGQPLTASAVIHDTSSSTELFNISINDASATTYFDPDPSQEHTFYVINNSVSGVIIPSSMGPGEFNLQISGSTFHLVPGEVFDLHAAGLSNVTAFVIDGPATAGNFVAGLQFDNTGLTQVAEVSALPTDVTDPTGSSTSTSDPAGQTPLNGGDGTASDGSGQGPIAGTLISLEPSEGDDSLSGGDGVDSIHLQDGNDTYAGGQGSDTVFGDAGNDFLFGNQDDDVLFGGRGQDVLFGGRGADIAYGGQDADLLFGNLGGDVLLGNLGSDTLYGGQGTDSLFGGQGDDVLSGDLSDDVLSGDLGNDVLQGGAGADRYVFGQNSGADLILGFNQGEGDRIDLQGQSYTLVTRGDGSAQLSLSGGGQVILAGVVAGAVNQSYFA